MPITHNAHEVAHRYTKASRGLPGLAMRFLDEWSERVAARMREKAPKGARSTLTNSIRPRRESNFVRFIGPEVFYALYVEKGRKPGKGLPRFSDPSARAAQDWLRSRLGDERRGANPKWKQGRLGSGRRQAEERELEDRYMAWSRSVKLHGIKPHPFVGPTAQEMRPQILAAAKELARQAGASVA